jgi:hypothetical protein
MQVVLVSATLPHEILEMTNKFMTDPVRILVKRDELTLEVGYFDLNIVTTCFLFSSSSVGCHTFKYHLLGTCLMTGFPVYLLQ